VKARVLLHLHTAWPDCGLQNFSRRNYLRGSLHLTRTVNLKQSNSILVGACIALAAAVAISLTAFTLVDAQTQAPVVRSATPVVSQPQPELKLAPATPIAEKKAELGDDQTWQPEWDVMVEEVLPPELLSSQVSKAVKPFCPRFSSLREADKRAYWAYFFQALAGAEAGLKPTTNVRHTEPEVAVKDDVTHRIVRQQGLLQLTYMDSQRYDCEFDWDADKELDEHDPAKTILQPRNNLQCGVKILKNQLIDQHKPLLSPTSYWVTLRPGTYSYQLFYKQMANVPEVCGRRTVRSEHKPELAHDAPAQTLPTLADTMPAQPAAAGSN
jgi:hypothetical protein